MKKLIAIYKKNKEIINYVFVGALSTVVSLGSYYIFSHLFNIEIDFWFTVANILSWICTVAFAYVTNKQFVFESKTETKKETFEELIKFVSARIFSLLADLFFMFLFVKVLHIENFVAKLSNQFIILTLNYLLSKLLVFKKHNQK